ncbi:MAG: ribosome small subunit-dependent GTPase A [Oxalobacter sp.]|nr:MAG: ribosome small subunit-dependent GTPase A [Oxalobacter sp.]
MITATVVAAHGRNYVVQAGGQRLHCVTRGKKSDIAVGDQVKVRLSAPSQGVIESIDERHSLLYRSDQYKSKLLAANVTQLFIVVATEPSFSDDLISRALVAAEAAEIPVHIILNKADLPDMLTHARARLQQYASLAYPVHEVSALVDAEKTRADLMPLLRGKTTVLIGQSGMGKSSLINLLVPDADIATREISTALNSGKHTTTFTRLYSIDAETAVVDSPGFQEFGLYHLKEGALERAFREFAPFLGGCRFYNCHHLVEPGCAILEAVSAGKIHPARHALYAQLVHESSQKVY